MKKMWAVKGFVGGLVGGLVAMIVILGMAQKAQATALSAERSTPEIAGVNFAPIQGSNVVYAGSIIVINSSGTAEAATDAASKKVIGRCERTSDNTGANYSATKTIRVKAGIFRWVNGDTFTDANIGDLAYIEDDQTVQKGASASSDIIAGTIVDVDDDGVWVNTYNIGANGAASVTTLAASGTATLGGALSVAGAATLSAAATVGTTLDVTGAQTIGGALGVTGATTLSTVQATQICLDAATNYFDIVSATQLVFVCGAKTNVVDADITTP